jgi:DNA replication protein DnaC
MDFNEFLDTKGIQLPERQYIHFEDAEDFLHRGLKYHVGDGYQWLPEYNRIVEWLKDNQGKGLLCFGDCGRGKTLICYHILNTFFSYYMRMNYLRFDAVDLGDNLDIIKEGCTTLIDDVGTELPYSSYGMKRECFSEIVDRAEKTGQLLIITTNLSLDNLIERYGKRTCDRLRSITIPVLFSGDSLRT